MNQGVSEMQPSDRGVSEPYPSNQGFSEHTLATRGLAALAPLGVMMALRYSCTRGHMSTMRSLLRKATAISSSKHTCSPQGTDNADDKGMG